MKKFITLPALIALAVLAGCATGPLKKNDEPAVVQISRVSFRRPTPVVTSPRAFASLQPFKKFHRGEGEGVAFAYHSRTKEQLIRILRDPRVGKREMRVACDVLVRQMVEAHPGLPFEGCEGAATAIASDDYQVVACRNDMFRKANWLTVTNAKGTAWGVWHRSCLPRERVLVYKGEPLLSTMCLNVAIPAVISPPSPLLPTPLLPIQGACPAVYTLKVNVWNHKALALPGVERANAEEELEEKFAGTPHVSRTHGGQFRRAYAAGVLKRSEVTHVFQVSLIMTPEAAGGPPTITSEKIIGDVSVLGMSELRFTREQLETWDAIRLVPVADGSIASPPRYHLTGLHELRFFNHLPGTKLGEWDDDPVPDCVMNEHWIEQ